MKFEIRCSPPVRINRSISGSGADVIRGQALEQALGGHEALRWPSYERAIRGKTSALFAMPARGAGVLASLYTHMMCGCVVQCALFLKLRFQDPST